ncbi:unnamed protein product [Prorocentrum cordatum]|uniref:Uncharacterized protein n=1 Tax=Prorocentrum cordatum TaxID=2364126 RepID=A0ABN9WEG3_9DINO|nr:unnamed protein product [Polarella glacialis]
MARRAAGLVRVNQAPERWLPVPTPTKLPSPDPRPGWMVVERWKEAAEDRVAGPVLGCSDLVRTLRRALRGPPKGAPPISNFFWQTAAKRAGKIVDFLSAEEACELLSTLADARLHWKASKSTTEGLRRMAAHAGEEIGSFSPAQLSEFTSALARLEYYHDDYMQALSRAVERTVRSDRGRLSNESACRLLDAYHRLGVLDGAVMKSLSRLVCRRLVREPLTPEQTAGVALAFAELRARDLALFNATTLALSREHAVEALDWGRLADVAWSYASLQLHSASLFSRIRARVCDSAGVVDETSDAGTDASSSGSVQSPKSEETAKLEALIGAWSTLREQLSEAPPLPPPIQLPRRVVVRLLEAQLHLGQLGARDLRPLLPHLAHRPLGDASPLLAAALGRGGHTWPWLWQQALGCIADDRSPPHALLSMMESLAAHFALLGPQLPRLCREERRGSSSRRRAGGGGATARPSTVAQHLQALAGGLAALWRRLEQGPRALSDLELRRAAAATPGLGRAQEVVADAGLPLGARSSAEVGALLLRAAARTARALAAELLRRGCGEALELEALLRFAGAGAGEVRRDLLAQSLDDLDAPVLDDDAEAAAPRSLTV